MATWVNKVGCAWTAVLFTGVLIVIWLTSPRSTDLSVEGPPSSDSKEENHIPRDGVGYWEYTVWPKFSLPQTPECLAAAGDEVSIVNFLDKVSASQNSNCRTLEKNLRRIFRMDNQHRKGNIFLRAETIQKKVRAWLHNDSSLYESVFDQHIVKMFNLYTHDMTLFNPLRSNRPSPKVETSEKEYLDEISRKSQKTCDFCNYSRSTAEDAIGRIESHHSVTASNVFKYDVWHTLVLSRSHHPTDWSEETFLDMFKTGLEWLRRVHKLSNEMSYPSTALDVTPRGGASQLHPHIHFSVQPNNYFGLQEVWRMGADRYTRDWKDNYFSTLVAVHHGLGLTVKLGNAVGLCSLTPKKENEVIVLAEEASEDFIKLVHRITRAFVSMEEYSFSVGSIIPPLGDQSRGRPPAVLRIVTRGRSSSIPSDVSGLELFMFSNVNKDPFRLCRQLREHLPRS